MSAPSQFSFSHLLRPAVFRNQRLRLVAAANEQGRLGIFNLEGRHVGSSDLHAPVRSLFFSRHSRRNRSRRMCSALARCAAALTALLHPPSLQVLAMKGSTGATGGAVFMTTRAMSVLHMHPSLMVRTRGRPDHPAPGLSRVHPIRLSIRASCIC